MTQLNGYLNRVRTLVSAGCLWLLVPALALAQSTDPKPWQLNMARGVTATSENAYEAHMIALWVCVVIGVLVFGAMGYAMFKFRKSKGAVPATFTHSATAEAIWTVVPIIILVVMAWPATAKLIAMYDTREAEMTVKVTGYQWMWKYEYLGEEVEFTSRLDRASDLMRQSGAQPNLEENPHYLRDVDNALVLPVDTKIRFVITADDVIHAWWVPALGWKQDAIPGIINEAWTEIRTPGVYRGQCAELCGKDHGFMPIVVRAVPKQEFQQWLAEQRPAPPAVQPAPAPAPVETLQPAGDEVLPPSAPEATPVTSAVPAASPAQA